MLDNTLKPSSEKQPSETRQWIWGFHSNGLPKYEEHRQN